MRVDEAVVPLASAAVDGNKAVLALSVPVLPQQSVAVDYLGSAMQPLRDAEGMAEPGWTDLDVRNRTGRVNAAPASIGSERLDEGLAPKSLSLARRGLGNTMPALARDLLRLDLSGNELVEVSLLSGLKELRSLDVSDNEIEDLWPLAGLTALRRLDVSGNRIADLEPLAGLPRLEVLVVDANLVTDVGALVHLARLENLGLSDNAVADLEPLADLSLLRRLDLGGNPTTDASPLGDLGTLVWLRLPATAAAPVERLVRLRWLWRDGECLACGSGAAERGR